jgi:hypothetical protein
MFVIWLYEIPCPCQGIGIGQHHTDPHPQAAAAAASAARGAPRPRPRPRPSRALGPCPAPALSIVDPPVLIRMPVSGLRPSTIYHQRVINNMTLSWHWRWHCALLASRCAKKRRVREHPQTESGSLGVGDVPLSPLRYNVHHDPSRISPHVPQAHSRIVSSSHDSFPQSSRPRTPHSIPLPARRHQPITHPDDPKQPSVHRSRLPSPDLVPDSPIMQESALFASQIACTRKGDFFAPPPPFPPRPPPPLPPRPQVRSRL